MGQGFSEEEQTTLGLDFVSKDVHPKTNKSFQYNLKVWDTAGQERFHSMTQSFYKQANGMIICFDVTRKKTFDSVKRWINICEDNCEDGMPIILVGNKCDLEDDRQIMAEDAEQVASELDIPYFEVSAKTNLNINSLFDEMIDLIYLKSFAS